MPARYREPVCEPANDCPPCPDCGCTETLWVVDDDGTELICPECPIGEHRLVLLVTLGKREE
jgi:hypothetical protein